MNQLLLPLRNRLLLLVSSLPLLVPAAHLLGLFNYGDFSARRSFLIDYFLTFFVVSIWLGIREWWHEKRMPPPPIQRPPPRPSRLHMVRVFVVFYLKVFLCIIVVRYVYEDLMTPLMRAMLGLGELSLVLGFSFGHWLIAPYFFVVPTSRDFPRPERP